MAKKSIEVHPAAKIMPEMSAVEYEAFKADIEKNGQREPVLIYENMVLDGRHRVRACDELGISVETVDAEKDWDIDPYSYVVSVNVHRRHLTVGQRSMIAAGLAAMKVGDNQHTKEGGQNCPPSIEDAAKLLNVSKGSVKAAKHLLETGSEELIDSVERGELSVSVADKVASTVPKNKQAALVKKGKKAVQESVKSANGKPKADKPAEREVGDEPEEPDSCIVKDDIDRDVPQSLRGKHSLKPAIIACGNKLNAIIREVETLSDSPGGEFIQFAQIKQLLKDAKGLIQDAAYYTECPDCKGKKCSRCEGGAGFIPKRMRNMLSDAEKGWLGI